MYTTFTTKSGKTINVTATKGSKPARWSPAGQYYSVSVRIGNAERSFGFWDSYHNKINGKPCDLRGALAAFAGDALTGRNAESSADIMSEFGYDDPKEANRVFKGVKHAQEQAEYLGLSVCDLDELNDY